MTAGDLLAQIDARPYQARLAQAEAAKARDVAQLANARLDLVRFQNLKDYATRQSVDTQKTQVSMLEAAIQGDQGQIDEAKVQLGYTTITSPIDGRTGIRLVDQGNIVHAADPNGLVVITQLQPISVIFTLPGTILPKLSRAHAAGPLKVEAWSQDDSEKLDDGELTLIDNQIDQSTGTMKLKASFPNKAETLWPGQFVNAHLLLETRRDGITVPAQAIQRGPAGTYVWLVKPDNTVEMRPVTLGRIVGDLALLDQGVAAGEKIVTGGQYKLVVGIKTEPHSRSRRRPRACPAPSRPARPDEHLDTVHRTADRDIAADGGAAAGRPCDLPLLPVAPLPQVDFPTIQVSAALPGASPETMASSVATPLERQFAQIAGVTQLTSMSVLGHGADHRAVRPQPQHRRRRPGCPGGDQRRRRRSCPRTCRARRPIARSTRPIRRS